MHLIAVSGFDKVLENYKFWFLAISGQPQSESLKKFAQLLTAECQPLSANR